MSLATTENWDDASWRHRVTVEEFGRMAEAGVFGPGVRVELIEGEIFEMSPSRSPHAFVVAMLSKLSRCSCVTAQMCGHRVPSSSASGLNGSLT